MGCGEALAVRQVYKALERGIISKGTWTVPWAQSLTADLETVGEGQKSLPSLFRIPKGKEGAFLSLCFDYEATNGKKEPIKGIWKKHMPAIAVADEIPYVATACPSYPFDLIQKVQTAWEMEGSAYIHILSPCPVGWKHDADISVKIGRAAVESRIFPLYEVAKGEYRMTVTVPNPRPVKEYMEPQGRFKKVSEEEIQAIQEEVDQEYSKLMAKASIE
jgi:hypothetical protein